MKFFTKKETSKKIIILLLLVMVFNFTTPRISQADFGGVLFAPIAELLRTIADLVVSKLQQIFVGNSMIEIAQSRSFK